jgi:hypothetical protein
MRKELESSMTAGFNETVLPLYEVSQRHNVGSAPVNRFSGSKLFA